MRKQILLQTLLVLGFLLCACDENNIVSGNQQSRDVTAANDTSVSDNGVLDTVKSIYSLGSCTEQREGKVSYVTKDALYYLCVNQMWVATSLEELESSSSVESSSSAKRSAADDDETDSDSSKAESSSAAKDAANSSSGSVSSSSAKATSSSAGVNSSSSARFVLVSSSANASSSSAKSSSSVNKSPKYDCSVYNCVSTENLNQEMLAAGKYGELLDTRDDQVYRTVTIGTQTWMAQNLNYAGDGSYCYGGTSSNCVVYGRLYLWSSATSACPAGWHLPSVAEWNQLVGGTGSTSTTVAKNLEYTGWNKSSDLYGFSVLPAGFKREDGKFFDLGSQTLFWTSASMRDIGFTDEYFFTTNSNSYGFSVRCLKNESADASSSSSVAASSSSAKSSSSVKVSTTYDCTKYNCVTTEYLNQEMLAAGKYGELLDTSDNQVYRTIVIGSQTWTAQNMNYSKKGTTYCYDDVNDYCLKYGRLYIRESVHCPTGWHLPSDTEWEELFDYVGGRSVASAKLRASTGWDKYPDLNDADEYGFSSLPGGVYYFGDEGGTGWYLSDTGYNDYAINSGDAIAKSTAASYTAISVRCVKD